MRLTIKSRDGKVLGVWVARTSRGFNKKQKTEIAAVRAQTRIITRSELARLSFCNSTKLPLVVNLDDKRMRWVGIGWVDEGKPTGREVKVID